MTVCGYECWAVILWALSWRRDVCWYASVHSDGESLMIMSVVAECYSVTRLIRLLSHVLSASACDVTVEGS